MLTIYFREHRKAAKLTQQQLADRIGTSKSRISMKENGKEGWDRDYLGALAEALAIRDPMSLLTYNPLDPTALQDVLQRLTPEDRAKVDNYAETLEKARKVDDKAA